MTKDISFVCSSCGYDSKKWYGKCPECQSWNTFQEFRESSLRSSGKKKAKSNSIEISSKPLRDINVSDIVRLSTQFTEFDRVLGGEDGKQGIVPGSITLVSGDPGVGKSTILLQIAFFIAQKGKKVLYITGEESEGQIRLRAERVNKSSDIPPSFFLLASTRVDDAIYAIEHEKPDLVIVDSIQTIASESVPGFAGSVAQVRFATHAFVDIGKTLAIPVFLVGHVTKEGIVAGPMTLSHMVDTVLYLEGEKATGTRILRSHKNRFGDTTEVGIFVMEENGLIELADASSFFIDQANQKKPGACYTVILEGTRPLLIEIQALTVPTNLSFPRRASSGVSEKRLEILIAILQKHLHIPLDKLDVYINVAGGMTIKEPASDLAVCLAIISSVRGIALDDAIACGEVGLLGEIKPVTSLEKRKKEAKKFGFKTIFSFETASELAILGKSIK